MNATAAQPTPILREARPHIGQAYLLDCREVFCFPTEFEFHGDMEKFDSLELAEKQKIASNEWTAEVAVLECQ